MSQYNISCCYRKLRPRSGEKACGAWCGACDAERQSGSTKQCNGPCQYLYYLRKRNRREADQQRIGTPTRQLKVGPGQSWSCLLTRNQHEAGLAKQLCIGTTKAAVQGMRNASAAQSRRLHPEWRRRYQRHGPNAGLHELNKLLRKAKKVAAADPPCFILNAACVLPFCIPGNGH